MRWIVAIFVSALLIIEAVAVDRVWRQHLGDTAAMRSQWPTTQGTITSSKTATDDDYVGDLVFLIRFTYEVGGVRYSGAQDWSVQEYGQERRYSQGAAVTVYYNPNNPKTAVIEPRLPSEWDLWQMIPYTGWLIAVFGIIWSWLWAAHF
ncbi:MAG: DUF3592 domain-containing protein [Chloroflexi bacterium]|nr:DUF3592 domain-containing protein [Chloroflexota bacterium]